MSAPPSNRPPAVRDVFRKLGDAGLFRSLANASSLGRGARQLARLAREADHLGTFLSIIAAAGLAAPILKQGIEGAPTNPLILGLLADALAGRVVLAVAITERDAGSDVASMRTALHRADDGSIRLRGAKWHITNAPVADAVVVFAVDTTSDDRFLTAVVVRRGDRGVKLGPPLDLIGCKGSPTGEIWLEDVPISETRIVGRRVDGRALLDLAFVRERVLAPWPLLGKMERVLEECLDHVETREQFGRPIHEFQFVQEKILSSFEAMLHARHLAERAVESVVRGAPHAGLASLAKAAAADAAAHTFRSAIEVFGSYGVQAERRYGDWLNDALCAQIAGGTRETHKKVVFGELRLERARARTLAARGLGRTPGRVSLLRSAALENEEGAHGRES